MEKDEEQPVSKADDNTSTDDKQVKPAKKSKKSIKDTSKGTTMTGQPVEPIDVSPQEKEVTEAAEKTAVFTFGRMNPPTAGHEKLINKVEEVAKKHGTKGHIVVSHSQDSKNNPLPQKNKIKFVQKINRNVHVHGSTKEHPNFLAQAKKFSDAGHEHLVMVAGSDRVNEYKKILDKYNGQPDHHNFKSIKVVSAGQRDPDAEGATGISGTKMRNFARSGQTEKFKEGLPKALHPHADQIIGHIKEDTYQIDSDFDLYLQESFDQEIEEINEYVLTLAQRRKRKQQMRRIKMRMKQRRALRRGRIADPERLLKRARKAARQAVRKRVAGEKGLHYADLTPGEKILIDKRVEAKKKLIDRLARKLLPKVRKADLQRVQAYRSKKVSESTEVKQDSDINNRAGTQPAKYHVGLSPATKAKRDAQFKQQAAMQDDDPKAYKLAPGDATAKTQLSKYTKAYRSQFEDATQRVGARHEREKAALKRREDVMKARHDREMDRARLRDTRRVNASEQFNVEIENPSDLFEAIDYMLDKIELQEKSIEGLQKKADKSGISYGILKKVYDRGMAAWKSGHRPGTTPQQWAFARVNSFITGGKTRTTADKDLWAQVREETQLSEETIIGGKSFDDLELCGDAVKQFKKDYQTADDKQAVLKAAQAVDDYLAVERRAMKNGATEKDLNDIESGVMRAKKVIQDAGLSSSDHNYHKIHINAIKDMMQRETNEAKVRSPSIYRSPAHAKLQKFVDKQKSNQDFWNKLAAKSQQQKTDEAVEQEKSSKEYAKDTPDQKLPVQLAVDGIPTAKGDIKKPNVTKIDEAFEGMFGGIWAKPAPTVSEIDNPARDKFFKGLFQHEPEVAEAVRIDDYCEECDLYEDLVVEEAEYDGKKVKLNDPIRTSENPKKKFKVYVRNDQGNVVVVRFGDPNLEIKRDDPARRRSFRARHNCADPGPKWKARYWSCWQWRAGAKVDN